MPMRPPHPCNHTGCSVLTHASRCPEHTRAQRARFDATRLSPRDRGYDRTWRVIRRNVLAEEPTCRVCGERANEVDHMLPLNRGGTNERTNLQALCHSCHSRKTASEDGGFGQKPAESHSGRGGGRKSGARIVNRAWGYPHISRRIPFRLSALAAPGGSHVGS